jgi:hypothetical protein
MSDPGRTDERRITAVLHGWGVAAMSTEDGAGQRLRHLPAWEFARNLATALAGPGGDGASVPMPPARPGDLAVLIAALDEIWPEVWPVSLPVKRALPRGGCASALAAAGATGEGGGG